MSSKSDRNFDWSSSDSSKHKSKYRDKSSCHSNRELRHKSTEVPKSVFNFERHKFVLNKMFFTNCEKVKIGTKEYEEFWLFLRKYQLMEEKAIAVKGHQNYGQTIKQKMANNKTQIPEEWTDISSLMSKTSFVNDLEDRYYETNALTTSRVIEFRDIACLYLDFIDKQKAKALEKLKQMQLDLPIARFREEIIKTIETHSVVLIAGDTGFHFS